MMEKGNEIGKSTFTDEQSINELISLLPIFPINPETVTKMAPEPLKLEDIEDIILDEQFGDLTFHAMMDKIKERIRSACEFYLRYFDEPSKLRKEHPELKDELDVVERDTYNTPEYYGWSVYNKWLFKLAFKDVLNGGEEK